MTFSFSKTSSLFKAFLLCSAALFLYSFSMAGDFKTDDRFSILLNPLIRDWSHLPDFFKQGYFGDQSYYRPFVYLTYTFEYHLFGSFSLFYNLDNVLIHIINALLVWKLADLLGTDTVSTGHPGQRRAARLRHLNFGFWVAFIFTIHPIHWEAVANISGRSVLLCTMFSLASMIAFIRSFQQEKALRLAVSIGCFALALLSKESAAVLPGVFFFYIVCTGKSGISWKKTGLYLLPFAGVLAGYVFLRKSMGLDAVYLWPSMQTHLLGFVSFLRSLITHLRLMVWPVGLYFDRSQAVYPSLEHPEVLYVAGFWLLLIVEGWIHRRHIRPLERLCLAWIALELFPVSQMIAAVGVSPGWISAADHFLYAAVIPFIILTLGLLVRIAEAPLMKIRISRWSIRAVLTAFAVFLAVINIQQNLYARDERTMLKQSLAHQPHNARLQHLAGYLAVEDKDYRAAEAHFARAVEMDPQNPSARIALGKVLCDQNRFGEGLTQYLLVQNPGSFARLLEDNIRHPAGILQKRVESGRNLSQSGWFGWGLYQARQGRFEDAAAAMEHLLVLNPEHIQALMTLASFEEAAGRIRGARECYLRLMKIDAVPGPVMDQVIRKLADLRLHYPEAFDFNGNIKE